MRDLKIGSVDQMIQQPPLIFESSNEYEILTKVMNPLYERLVEFNDVLPNGTVEVVARQMALVPIQPFLDFNGIRKSNKKYIAKELDWYLSQDLSIKGHVDDIKIWNLCCTKDERKEVNSNYGYLLFNEENGSQYDNCLDVLLKDKTSRNAIIVYNRPSIYDEYTRDGMHDMICTMFSHFMIRHNALYMIHVMRSNDLIFGFMNDFAWTCFVYQNMYSDLKDKYPKLEIGRIFWQSDSMHVYERHFELLKKIVGSYKERI